MSKVVPCLWFDGQAEAAAEFYVSLLPKNSKIDRVSKSPSDTPAGVAGTVLIVEFTLAGSSYVGLNGGPQFQFSEAVSFQIHCEDQAEVDRLWDAILTNGGSTMACGWIKDKWGLSWQIYPTRVIQLLNDPDPDRARRAHESTMTMIKIDLAEVERAADGASAK